MKDLPESIPDGYEHFVNGNPMHFKYWNPVYKIWHTGDNAIVSHSKAYFCIRKIQTKLYRRLHIFKRTV